MKDNELNEAQLSDLIDLVISGKDISEIAMTDEQKSTIGFAAKIRELGDQPPGSFRDQLRLKLQAEIAQRESVQKSRAAKDGFFEWLRNPAIARVAWGLAGTAVIVLISIGIFSVLSTVGGPAATPIAGLPPFQSVPSIDLPSRIVPSGITFSESTSLSGETPLAVVYSVGSPDVNTRSVSDLGNRLGFIGEARISSDGQKITMNTGSGNEARQLTVWTASGAVEYGYIESEREYPISASDLPTEKEAKKAAYDFLKQADLLPSAYNDYAKLESKITVTSGSKISTSPGYWIVDFPYLVDNSFGTGSGATLELNIGNKGEVLKLVWSWRPLSPAYSLPIISQAAAYVKLAQGNGSIDVPSNSSKLVIKRVQLSYWINPVSEGQTYALPVYEVTGQSLDQNGKSIEDFNGWIEAYQTSK
jgi:hypothetical protein